MANLSDDLSANFHALGVGVGYYKNLRDLPATVNDVTLLQRTLLDPERCGYRRENVQTLIAKDATLPRMREELARLSWVTGPGSTVIIFFSGHGYRPPRSDSAGYLCLHEADLDHLEETTLSATEFSEAIRALRAERIVVILDCCHANKTAQIKSPGGAQWKSG
ncbi:MAG TPA: caspase family protein, partial [Ktedonobacterales bacterium]|nr:caspase family protein [Ktedonobacterales bacterium]